MRRLSACVLLLAAAPAVAPDYPHVTLVVQGVQMTVFTPDPEKGFYRGSRFAWAGVLKDLKFGGHTLFGPWKDGHNPANNDDITGPAEEFGMSTPLGYDEAKVGGRFVKIGVGELEKPKEAKYSFFTNYKVVNPGVWKVAKGTSVAGHIDQVVFRQTVRAENGYAYHYVKTVGLTVHDATSGEVGLELAHQLINVGDKPIRTDVYNHNFFNVDGHPVGPRYKLVFQQTPKPTADSKFGEVATFAGMTYTFKQELGKESPFGQLTGPFNKPLANEFDLVYSAGEPGKGVRVQVRGWDQTVTKFQTWSVRGCMCPEPFVAVNVEPGDAMSWKTNYMLKKGTGE